MDRVDQFDIYQFNQYREYLIIRLNKPGARLSASHSINCHSTYLSRVLKSRANLSLEQAMRMNDVLNHDENQSHYFLLLVQMERAGTKELREYFLNQIQSIQENRRVLKNRIGKSNEVLKEHKTRYYSRWYYSAVHILVSISKYQTLEEIASYLKFKKQKVFEILEFLADCGLVIQNGNRFEIGPTHIHVPKDDELSTLHHANWRQQAMLSLENNNDDNNINYTGVFSLSYSDVERIKENILSCLKENTKIVMDSKEEALYIYTFDFFELKK